MALCFSSSSEGIHSHLKGDAEIATPSPDVFYDKKSRN